MAKKRDYVHTTDFERADYEEVMRLAQVFQEGVEKGENFTHLCPGKVLASMFLKESTRTMTSFQSAIIRLGGGYTGLTGTKGTYLDSGEETIDDIVSSIAEVSDVMALRYNDCDPHELAKKIDIPLINGMCGGEEHASGALALIYPLAKEAGSLKSKKIGMYGMVSASRPMKAVMSALSTYDATFVIDPVMDYFKAPDHIEELVKKRGGAVEYAPVDEWIGDVDMVVWVEALPQAGTPEKPVNEFNTKFQQFTKKDIPRLRDDALFLAVTPRLTTDGRLTVTEDCDDHPCNATFTLIREFQYVAMALIAYCLEVEVK